MAKPKRRPARPWALDSVPSTTRFEYDGTRGARDGVMDDSTRRVQGSREAEAKSMYASSTMTTPFHVGCARIASTSVRGIRAPVGLPGEQRNTSFMLGSAERVERIAETSGVKEGRRRGTETMERSLTCAETEYMP